MPQDRARGVAGLVWCGFPEFKVSLVCIASQVSQIYIVRSYLKTKKTHKIRKEDGIPLVCHTKRFQNSDKHFIGQASYFF